MLEKFIRSYLRRCSIINILFLPLTAIYLLMYAFKLVLSKPQRVDAHVVCVGNVVAGGSGKTPFCLALGEYYLNQGKKVAFISRGYNGSLSHKNNVVKLNSTHSYLEVGDEPLLLAKIAPTYICIDRYLSALKATKDGAEIIIMDDGLQNFTLHQDEKILLFDSDFFIGNGFLIPAGPLREPLNGCLNRVDSIVVIGDKLPEKLIGYSVKLFKTEVKDSKAYVGQRYVLMSSIANPEKFEKTARSLQIGNIKHFRFADHHKYIEADIKKVISKADEEGCKILTTTKDIVKIPKKFHYKFKVLEIFIDLGCSRRRA